MATLELRGLEKSFDGVPVVRGLDLEVRDGELLVLLGASGCGKSTVLRLIGGLESPDAGEIVLDGAVVNQAEPRDRDVAMVFQNYALYPHMSVRQNIGFPLRMARLGRAARAQRIEEAAGTLDIAELLDRKPAQLSGGQQQRVALARALVRRPRIFLFDEPLSNVDARLRTQMRAELARLHLELGATMIYVTHDQVEAMTLGTRIALLHEGVLQQVGTPADVFREPANLFVAGFLGSPPMNLLCGPARRALSEAGDQEDAVLGFRPHDARLVGRDESGLTACVELVEELGSEALVHARAGEEPVVIAVPPGTPVERGQEIGIGVPPDALHRFDARSGERSG